MVMKSSTIARRRDIGAVIRVLSVVMAASALSGCYAPRETASVPNDYRKRHPIGLRDGERTVEVFLGANRGALTPAQRADVAAFAQAWKRESTGGVIIDVPSGTPNAYAASDATREIRAIFAASGIPGHGVAVRPYQSDNPYKLSALRMSYSRIMAEAGPCGLWPQDLGPSPDPNHNENKPYWNLGCANQRNLAAMVDTPSDLVQPRGESPAWASRRTTVLEKYRSGQSPETTYPNQDKGKVSDVGQ